MLKVSFQRNDRERALPQLSSTEWLQEFQRKLHEKAKAEPKFRFYSLYDKMYRMEVLVEAYRKAKANRGASGVDEETFEDVEKKGVIAYLTALRLEMKERRYVPNRYGGSTSRKRTAQSVRSGSRPSGTALCRQPFC